MIKIGRNDPCPCGSGKKYKHCCFLDNEKNRKILHAAARAETVEDVFRIVSEPPRIYRLKVTLESMGLEEIEPEVSRVIDIQEEYSLYDLHLIIQKAFEWDNDHMFSFYMGNKLWDRENEYKADPLGEHTPSNFGDKSKPADETEIGDLSLKQGKQFKYLFDYGDQLVHGIQVVDIYQNTDSMKEFPKIAEKIGESPQQYGESEE
jgi:hypothetical protein